MQPEELILPAIATVALGTALLVPLRDDRPGKRATFSGKQRFMRPDLRVVDEHNASAPLKESADRADQGASDTRESSDPHDEPDHIPKPELVKPRSAVHAIADRLRRFFDAAPTPITRVPDSHIAGEHDTVERSFAEELSALLPVAGPAEPEADGPVRDSGIAITVSAEDEKRRGEVLVATPLRPPFERAVPLTRMPLRPYSHEITWPSLSPATASIDSRENRHTFLARNHVNEAAVETLLVAAYREEDAEGRLLAMRAILRAGLPVAFELLNEALHVGTDEERTFAVDALLAAKRPDAVVAAFSDRVDAVAAQAALGYVGSLNRNDYFAALEPHVDRARIESILALLAGIVA